MNKGLFAAVLMAAVLAAAGCESEPYGTDTNPDNPVEYTLVWQDEFDGPVDQSPDADKWVFDVGTGRNGWGNNQLEYDTDRVENVSLDGAGHLRIIAREEDYLGSDYTSGRIKTEGKFTHGPGRFEARIQLPVGQGIWPAFWLLGSDYGTVSWPACGEIDIMEYRGQAPNVVTGALHGPGYSGGESLYGYYYNQGGGFNEDFHVFTVDWTEDSITWRVDGQTYMTQGVEDLPRGTEWVYDHPFFIILNVAVGGNFVGSPDDTTIFPQTMLVDYVRVYTAD